MRLPSWFTALLVALVLPGLTAAAAQSSAASDLHGVTSPDPSLDVVPVVRLPGATARTQATTTIADTDPSLVDVLEAWDVTFPTHHQPAVTDDPRDVAEEEGEGHAPAMSEPSTAAATAPSDSPNTQVDPSPEPTKTPEAQADEPAPPCDIACRGDRILAANPLSPPPGWTITFEGPSTLLGMAYGPPRREVVIWIRDNHSDPRVGATLLHEIGHAWDFSGLNGHRDDARRIWAKMRGFDWVDSNLWFGVGLDVHDDFGLGAGDLAESVHACWAPGWETFRSTLAPPPTATQCAWLRDVIG